MKNAVVAIILNSTKEALCISRINNHNDFGLIGGSIDEGETPEQAIVREVYEETGLKLSNPLLLSEETNSEGKLIYTYTFPFVDFTGLKLGLGDEGVVAFKDIVELYDETKHTYGAFNKKQFENYISKSMSGEIQHRVSYPFKIGDFKLILNVIDRPLVLGDVIVHINAELNQGTIIKISNENEDYITKYFAEHNLTVNDLSKSFMLVRKSNHHGVGVLWTKDDLDNIRFSEELGFSSEFYSVNLKLNTAKL